MELSGERVIVAPRARVWDALNDPEVLKGCIPGCESLERVSLEELKAVAGLRIGPMSAKFGGKIRLSDLDPPNGYTISGEGQGGAAGFAKGGAKVRLAEAPGGGTQLSYEVDVQVGGKMAQIGGRLIDATARSMADQFFTRFAAAVEGSHHPAAQSAPSHVGAAGLFAGVRLGRAAMGAVFGGALLLAFLLGRESKRPVAVHTP